MPRIIPREELMRKTAALQGADAMGREMARELANMELAKMAGQVLKEAGFNFSGLGKKILGSGPVKQIRGVGRSAATFGKVAPWLLGGGLAYGAIKGIPWAARQLEQSSGQSMAPSMGWSATPYGYGYNPYGNAMSPTMGAGA